MTYRLDKIKKQKKSSFLIFVLVFLLALTLGWAYVREKTYPIAEPVVVFGASTLSVFSNIPHNIMTYIRSRQSYEATISALQVRTEELENQLALLRANETLGEPHHVDNETLVTIALYPLTRDVTTLYDSILLSKGFTDGVVEGALVYVRGRQLVCLVKEVHRDTSLCALLSAPGNTVEAVTSTSSLAVTLIGEGGGNYIALLPKESPLSIGEVLMYRASPTMKLGEVVEIKNDPQDVFVRVYIRGAYNPVTSSLFYVDKQ